VRYIKETRSFGNHLKKLRKTAGLSQQALADDAEISIRTVQRIEKGEFSVTLDIVLALAEGLNIHPKELFDIPM